jgi:HAD superfamily phosphatase (TIGR01668 family)
VRPFAESIGLPFQARAAKPLPHGYRAAAVSMGLAPRQCVAVGDQIFTDILGANLAGVPSVLLEPIEPEVEQKFIVFKRRFERVLLNTRRQKRRREEEYRHAQ